SKVIFLALRALIETGSRNESRISVSYNRPEKAPGSVDCDLARERIVRIREVAVNGGCHDRLRLRGFLKSRMDGCANGSDDFGAGSGTAMKLRDKGAVCFGSRGVTG